MQTSEQLALSSPSLLHRAFSFPSVILSIFLSLFFFLLSFSTSYLFLSSRFHSSTPLHQTYPVSLEFLPLSRERNTVWFIQPLCTVCWIVKFFSLLILSSPFFSFRLEGGEKKKKFVFLCFVTSFPPLRFRLPFSITVLSNISQLRRFMGNYKDTECVSVAWWPTWLNFYCRCGQDFFLLFLFFLLLFFPFFFFNYVRVQLFTIFILASAYACLFLKRDRSHEA